MRMINFYGIVTYVALIENLNILVKEAKIPVDLKMPVVYINMLAGLLVHLSKNYSGA